MLRIVSVEIYPPRQPSWIANASVRLQDDSQTIELSDLRLLRNRAGKLWVGMPTIGTKGPDGWAYKNVVQVSRELHGEIEREVIDQFEESERQAPRGLR
jgi:DNA-binding cell septation regulator SpoVG